MIHRKAEAGDQRWSESSRQWRSILLLIHAFFNSRLSSFQKSSSSLKSSWECLQGFCLLTTDVLQIKPSCSCSKPTFCLLIASPNYTHGSIPLFINLAPSDICNANVISYRSGPALVHRRSCSADQTPMIIPAAVLVPEMMWSHNCSLLFVFTSLLKVLQVKLSAGPHCHLWYLATGELPLQRCRDFANIIES